MGIAHVETADLEIVATAISDKNITDVTSGTL